MRTAAYKVGVASDRRRRKNVPRHILCSEEKVAEEISKIRIKVLKAWIIEEIYLKDVKKLQI